ncbi:MAG: hypothetical protein R3C30_04860 [Hyphomonadaceae bacterium]
MSAAGLTHSQVAVMLIDGALAHIAGNARREMPFKGEPVDDLNRAMVGLKKSGQTMLYRVGTDGVFLDLDGPVAMVWFVGGDFDRALGAFEDMAKKNYRVRQMSDEALEAPKQRRRMFEVDLGNKRLAVVAIDYAERGAEQLRFRAHISALARK